MTVDSMNWYRRPVTVRVFMMTKTDDGMQYVSRPDWTFKNNGGHEGGLYAGIFTVEELALKVWKEGQQVSLWVVVVSENADTFDINDISFYEVHKVRFITQHARAKRNVSTLRVSGQMNTDKESIQVIKTRAIIEE